MQIGQNAKILNINNPKYSILGVPIENQCVKGGGLLYCGFGLLIYGIFCILSVLTFCQGFRNIDIGIFSELNTRKPPQIKGYHKFKKISPRKFHGIAIYVCN